MLLFVGQIPHEDTGRDAFQEVDYRQMFAPLAKWVTQIDHAKRIPEIVAHAVDVATSGRPGPVVIALSEEMQKDMVEVPDLPRAPMSAAPFPDPAALMRMRAMLAQRARSRSPSSAAPAGPRQGARRCRASCSATTSRSPSASAARRITTARRRISPATSASAPIPALIGKIKEADLILAIGIRLGDAVTQGYTLLDMAGSVPIVQVLPDGAEIGRVFRPALGIVSDLNAFAIAAAALEPVKPALGGMDARNCGRCARRSARCRTTRAR